MKMIKRFSLLSFVFILACSIVGCQQIDASQEQKQFDQFIQQEIVKTMENDYVATHITIAKQPACREYEKSRLCGSS